MIDMKKAIPVIVITFFSFLAGFLLLQPGLPPTHDGEYHIIRFYEFDKELRSGQWYPRWAQDLNNGYGVPLFNYVYPLPNYVASFLHAFGVSFIDAFKINMFLALVLGTCFMYLWARLYFGTFGGILSAVFYTYAPYHLLDIYIRGSAGEVWALAFFPAFLWSVTKLLKEKTMLCLPLSSIFFALVIFSHNILAYLFFPFAAAYMLFLVVQERKKLSAVLDVFLTLLLGFGLSSIFWVPALLERSYVRGLEIFNYQLHFVELYQLIFPSWGSGFSADATTEGLSFQIGMANIVALFVCFFLLWRRRKTTKVLHICLFMIIWLVAAIFIMFPFALFIWKSIPLIQYTQFPWRFLSLVILCVSFLAGSIAYLKPGKVFFLIFLVLPFLTTIGYTKPAYYHMRDDNYYISRSNFIDGTNSPGNVFNTIWFDTSLPKNDALSFDKGNATIINIAYFPGWQVFVNRKSVEAKVNKYGLIEIGKVGENDTIEAKFLDTAPRTIGKLLSGLSLLSLLLMLFNFSVHHGIISLELMRRKLLPNVW